MNQEHSGSKYARYIPSCIDEQRIVVDVYSVIHAFGVTNPGVAHAIKKLLCSGMRGVKTRIVDLRESIDAITRAIELEEHDLALREKIAKETTDNLEKFREMVSALKGDL